MKRTIFLLLVAVLPATIIAQSSDQYSGGRMMGNGAMPAVLENEDLQTKFIKREWSNGTVSFLNQKPTRKLPLLFDIYNNTLYYLENETIMEFLDPVHEFNIGLIKKSDSVFLHYRSNYPAVNTNTASTFYEVIVDGNFQLLRCKAKTINLYKNMDQPEEKRNYNKEQLYIYTPEKELVLIEKDKKQILQALPAYAEKISGFIDANKIKIKKEEGLIELVRALNE